MEGVLGRGVALCLMLGISHVVFPGIFGVFSVPYIVVGVLTGAMLH
jgi:hypothetical protein